MFTEPCSLSSYHIAAFQLHSERGAWLWGAVGCLAPHSKDAHAADPPSGPTLEGAYESSFVLTYSSCEVWSPRHCPLCILTV